MGITRQYEVDWTTPDYVEGEDPPGAIKKLDENQKQIFTEADKIRKHYAGTSAPENPEVGLIWQDTSTNPPTLRRWNGSSWDDLKVAEADHATSADSATNATNADNATNATNADAADKVDGFDVSSTPTANTLLPLDENAKFPNSVLYTGSGNGLDADKVDGYDASQTPAANTIPVADENGRLDDWISGFLKKAPDYDSGWIECGTDISRSTNQTYTYQHNLGTPLLFVLFIAHDKGNDIYLYRLGSFYSVSASNPIGFQWDSTNFYLRIYHDNYFLRYWGNTNNWVATDNAEYRILAWKLSVT